jgi:hypothetical protein
MIIVTAVRTPYPADSMYVTGIEHLNYSEDINIVVAIFNNLPDKANGYVT